METVVVGAMMDGGGMDGDMMPLRRIVGGDASNMRQRVADLLASDYACTALALRPGWPGSPPMPRDGLLIGEVAAQAALAVRHSCCRYSRS